MPFKVGCVPYLNAKPLVWQFQTLGEDSPVEVIFDVPSRLPELLDSGQVDAILVSSIEAFRRSCRVVKGVSISSQGAVESVRLFSSVPVLQIETLTLDPSSMTSNALALIILDTLNVRPEISDAGQARILIGDAGMRSDYAEPYVLDLGTAWYDLTGLPFVWAVWLGRPDLCPELADKLRASAKWGQENLRSFLPTAALDANFDIELAEKYLTKTMDYGLGPDHLLGLNGFRERLLHHEWIPDSPALEFI